SCRVWPKAKIGPFSRLRPGSDIREGAHVGGFVEIKKSVIHEGAKVPHLSYIGDATIGRDSNIGAGTITCNYDGFAKYPTTIGEGVFIGSDTALVAPVRVGRGAYVAAGSTITENVPADALAIARGRQANKPGWAATRRKELARAGKLKSSKRRTSRSRSKRAKSKRPRKYFRFRRGHSAGRFCLWRLSAYGRDCAFFSSDESGGSVRAFRRIGSRNLQWLSNSPGGWAPAGRDDAE